MFRTILMFSLRQLKKSPLRLAVVLLGVAGSVVSELFNPVLAKQLVDFLSSQAADPSAGAHTAWVYVGLFMINGVVYWTCLHVAHFVFQGVMLPAIQRVSEQALAQVQRFSTDWHQDTFAGATVTRIKRGTRAFEDLIDLLLFEFFPIGLTMIGITVLITFKMAALGFWIAVGMVVYATVSMWLSLKLVMPASREWNEIDSLSGGVLADIITNNPTVKSFATEKREDRIYHGVMDRFRLAGKKAWTRGEVTNLIQNTLMTFYKFLFLGAGVYLWARGQFSVGDFIFMFSSYQVISGHLRSVGRHLRRLQESASNMEDLVTYSLRTVDIRDRAGAKPLRATGGGIAFERVTFLHSNQKKPLFKDFNLSIAPGEKVALVGPSGSGKTTFVKLLQRLFEIKSGTIAVDGQDIRKVTLESLRQSLVLVPQDPVLFHRTLRENIAYGHPEASEADVIAAAQKAHAHEFILRLPQGYETLVGERGVKLSGGERQRVAIARAMLSHAPVLILDEATSSLDSESEKFIQESLHTLMKKRTTLVIAHRLSTIRQVDRILVFDRGQIVEEGPHEQLVQAGGLYQKLYELQAGGFI